MTYSKVIVIRISTLYKQRGIAYNKLAAMCGLNQSTIDNIAYGVTKSPHVQTLHHIALGFNMTSTKLLDYPELDEYLFDGEEH